MIRPITDCEIQRVEGEFRWVSVSLTSREALRELINALQALESGAENHLHLQTMGDEGQVEDEVVFHFPSSEMAE